MATTDDPKRRIIERLKRTGAATANDLAEVFAVSGTAIRQQLDQLETTGLVERTTGESSGRGRPPLEWKLSPLANELFPDRHAELTVELIDSIRSAVGEAGLDAVITERTAKQRDAYRLALPQAGTPVRIRAEKLADIRSAEGYMADVQSQDDGSLLLVEHHCPICVAATSCQNLCRDELETFSALFEGDATVTREKHLLAGDARCTYRITPTGT